MKQRKPTKEESDAMDNYGKPLKPQPELPSDAMEKKMMGGMMSDGISKKGSGIEMKSKGGMVRGQGAAIRGTKFKGIF